MVEETAHKVCLQCNSRAAAADIQILSIAMPLVVRLGEGAARPVEVMVVHPAIHRTTIVVVAEAMVAAAVVPTMIAGVVDFTTIVAGVPTTTIVAVVDHQTTGTAVVVLREEGAEEEVVVAMVATIEMAVDLAGETIITEEEAAKTMSIAAAAGNNWE
jgi:hypothetical protein